MAIFDIEKNELLLLSDTQLEELIARLSEAEIAMSGHSPAYVNWSGSINAPDEGIDIRVQVPTDKLNTGFLERPDTILQAKKHSMPKSEITNEMTDCGELSPTISMQAARSGSYIIVSLGDDCSPPMKKERLKAMWEAVQDDPNSAKIHLDFYDRSKLAQWLRQHPSVLLWVKGKLGQGYSGWQSYGAWSNPPQGMLDTLILAQGVSITLPSGKGRNLSIRDAIEPMRDLVRSTSKAIRITGLSGVGKTRIVQALFDETVGENALDKTVVIYVDVGADPVPSATGMLDKLIAENRCAIVVLDNCPSDLHSLLASKVSAAAAELRLITVEYDIKDDKPQSTEVIQIEAVGPEIAEQLIARRFPSISSNNARRIAEFSDGNARVSLAIAERVEEGESLAQLSDAELFNRLFEQRNHPDDNLREHAEILSLVYSFSISNAEDDQNELEVLGAISGHSRSQLFRSVRKLQDRHVVQKRGSWRAILPHVIANRLAASALDSIPVEQILAVFEAPDCQRLLMSFAHRLGQMHDHHLAKEIGETWLQSEGLLGHILTLDETKIRMLGYIAPAAPEALLNRIEAVLVASELEGIKAASSLHRRTIARLLQLLAYEPDYFDRSMRLLIQLADLEDEDHNQNSIRGKIKVFFQAYLSGTHATLTQRITIMKECLSSASPKRRSLGIDMLSVALSGAPWSGFGPYEFGARPRNFGYHPDYHQLAEWRCAFIDVAVQLGISRNSESSALVRIALASKFRSLWQQTAIRNKLVEAATKLHAHAPWVDGWRAVRKIIYLDHSKRENESTGRFEPLPDNLAVLDKELRPSDLLSQIKVYVLVNGTNYYVLGTDHNHEDANKYRDAERKLEVKAYQLGQNFALSGHKVCELGDKLFSNSWSPYCRAFGRGLAEGALDLRASWRQLSDQLGGSGDKCRNFAVIQGFLEKVDQIDRVLAQELLDGCAEHLVLRHVLVAIHPRSKFSETDLDRCMKLLSDPDIHPRMYGPLLWQSEYSHLPEVRIVDLFERLLIKSGGDDVVIDALAMRLHGREEASDTLGLKLRQIGLKAASHRLQRDQNQSDDYSLGQVITAVLRFDGNEADKLHWLDTIFAVADERCGYIHAFDEAISRTAEAMPNAFLNRVFECNEKVQKYRQTFITREGLHRSPLANVEVEVLIAWCCARNESRAWVLVAEAIELWTTETVAVSSSAIKLLEASPNPETVLEVYGRRIVPSSAYGSLTETMLPRAKAIGRLENHTDVNIATAAREVSERLIDWIEREKVREQHEHSEIEQRFE